MSLSPQSDHDERLAPVEAQSTTERRRAILLGLGKGGVALAALSPLASQAGRTHMLTNAALPGGNGYCSVSGFQSAAISGTPAPVLCGVYTPGHFLKPVTTLNYSVLVSNPAVNNVRLADALNTRYGLSGANVITQQMIGSTLLAATPTKLVIAAANAVILPGDVAGTGIELCAATTFPPGFSPTGAFNTLFTASSDSRTLLEVLSDGVLLPPNYTANTYFLATRLSLAVGGLQLPADFDLTYLNGQYSNANAAPGTPQFKFFQALCRLP